MASALLAYEGVNMGFNWANEGNWRFYLSLALKGFINMPLGGFLTLPLAYWLGTKTKWNTVFAEYFSGTLYSFLLLGVIYASKTY